MRFPGNRCPNELKAPVDASYPATAAGQGTSANSLRSSVTAQPNATAGAHLLSNSLTTDSLPVLRTTFSRNSGELATRRKSRSDHRPSSGPRSAATRAAPPASRPMSCLSARSTSFTLYSPESSLPIISAHCPIVGSMLEWVS